ncbi:hypothetical protein DSL72_009420 [Monilinia vaccinii-corymbosi]|uniref:Zn(2)-C6 fungal-type domain-containing protein n=1 Tax=Monilinia vaccinii-corymbosi TaxID=61207 RepID=A0A8A3PPA2_9HELO|nr:hypothetical protein DSL72_009420 [Monilinia vaccinii-corymbosi]
METITLTIPSPSALLSSPVPKPAPEPLPLPPPTKRKQSTSKPASQSLKKENGINKPKQSKSRNGCITCKAKRLKCDETKPSCQQCHKRSVTCGGYKKAFKWRPFEETAFPNKPAPPPPKKRDSIVLDRPLDKPTVARPVASDVLASPTSGEDDTQMQDSFFNAAVDLPSPSTFDVLNSLPERHSGFSPLFDVTTPTFSRDGLPRPRIEADSVTSSLSSMFEDTGLVTPMRSSFSGQSPRLIDLLQPGSELNARLPSTLMPSPILGMAMPSPNMAQLQMTNDSSLEDDLEEIIREAAFSDAEMWLSMSPFRAQSPSRTASPISSGPMYRQPDVPAGSPEMLMLRFDKQTCGILSVKDGPTENPWRTLVWPLAQDSPALYHAIASMTAFHTSKEKPALRVDGMEHMRRSIRSLAAGIEKMRTDTALATTLVLAFAESWDQHISTGIEHLRGAKILVNQALIKHAQRGLVGDDLARLKFLCNTWVYMDVLARLTSTDDGDSTDFENLLSPLNNLSTSSYFPPSPTSLTTLSEIDPLMGSAATLFPLIGRAANLCRKVQKSPSNSIATISQAIDLKQALEQWQARTAFAAPEDPTSTIHHALQTAEAYRFATLLHLHQAVPEIPSRTCAELAQKVLVCLAMVPLSSRLVIVQIYPLLAAGCEARGDEDRAWVEERWACMARRMWIGNIDRCWEVMQEVWRRRDELARREERELMEKRGQLRGIYGGLRVPPVERLEREMADGGGEVSLPHSWNLDEVGLNRRASSVVGIRQRQSISGPSLGDVGELKAQRQAAGLITEDMDRELTVRGRLHWVGVMKDWEWETHTPAAKASSPQPRVVEIPAAMHHGLFAALAHVFPVGAPPRRRFAEMLRRNRDRDGRDAAALFVHIMDLFVAKEEEEDEDEDGAIFLLMLEIILMG